MELREALDKANQILDEERSSPTVRYTSDLEAMKPKDSWGGTVAVLAALTEPQMLQAIRSQRPRQLEEGPRKWRFKSVNYDLLRALLSRVAEDSRPAFLAALSHRLTLEPGCAKSNWSVQPNWKGFVSEFPLIAEFCIRGGAKGDFLRTVGEAKPTLGLAVLLRHLEDMVALNFNVLADTDYQVLTTAIEALGYKARKQLKVETDAGRRASDVGELCREIVEAAGGVKEECRKARYLYLKGALQEGLNIEVNQDKMAVESYLKAQGFSDALIKSLNCADRIYQSASSGFDFKASMSHLRSFMEELHSEGLARLQTAGAGPTIEKWGAGLEQLQQHGVLTNAEKMFASALYTLLSDEGVHPIMAEKEYARLARNVVIEYALLFLCKSDKLRPSR
ncbi:MAG: hypothetical protein ABSE93_03795 [Terriglobia bacterium]